MHPYQFAVGLWQLQNLIVVFASPVETMRWMNQYLPDFFLASTSFHQSLLLSVPDDCGCAGVGDGYTYWYVLP